LVSHLEITEDAHSKLLVIKADRHLKKLSQALDQVLAEWEKAQKK
jgi:hypothetical protein